MHSLGAAFTRGLDQRRNIEIALGSACGANAHRDIGEARVQRSGIGVRIHRDDAHAEALRRARNPAGDLAAVGDQKGLEHVPPLRDQSSS